MLLKRRTAHDEGLQQIADWEAWFLAAQLDVINSNVDMHDDERKKAIAAAKTLAAAVGDQKRHEYLTWKNRVV